MASPGRQWSRTPIRFDIVPEGTKRAASLPNSAATRSWSSITVGSSPHTSSPTAAAAMAARIAGVGRVTVSLRKSFTVGGILAGIPVRSSSLRPAPPQINGHESQQCRAHERKRCGFRDRYDGDGRR